MKLFAVAAMGAVLVAGCAPFEHGHYATDVSYRNTTDDAPGTPLVFQSDAAHRAVYDPNALGYAASGTSNYTQTAYVQPTYSAPIQSYAAPQQISYAAPVTYSAAPVAQTYVAPTQYVQPAAHSTYSTASVQHHPRHKHSHGVVATTYGGQRVDRDGYLICDIDFPAHGPNQTPRY